MAVPIQFDTANVPLLPHLILATKSGKLIRELPIDDVQFHESLTGGSEFSFNVYRERCVLPDGGIDDGFWKGITDLRLVYCRDYDRWYELKVDRSESIDVLKSVTATSLAEAELSQINVYGIEVNTEADIEREDYQPTVLYNANKKVSLIDRLLYKAPHYSVKHVDDSIKDIQRTFSFDGKTIYDCFNEVSTEIGCLFLYDCIMDEDGGIDREISVYDLEYHCPVCGLRGEYMPVCDNCGNTTVPGYGIDTKIFVARENLAKEINYTTNTDAVKNCFRLQAGDDLMTAGVIACNPNGSQYIWYITDAMRADMSQALQDRLASYDSLYDYYQNEATYSPPSDLRSAYNTLIRKYQTYRSDLMEMPATITGYPAMMKSYFDTIDFQIFLESELMPSVEISTTSAAQELAKLTSLNLSPVAVAKISTCTKETADSAVIGMAKCLIRGTYQVKVSSSSYNTSNRIWTGKLTVTNYGDEEDTATHASNITIAVNEDLEKYIQQKIDRMINQTAEDPTDISSLFKLSLSAFTAELQKYCRNRLIAFRDACQAALDILIQQGVGDQQSWSGSQTNLYNNMYVPYKNKMAAIESELAVRSSEVTTVAGKYDENGGLLTHGMESRIKVKIDEIRSALDFESYIGSGLWEEFASYRREDVFQNNNYISDGLDNFKLMTNAQEFLNSARDEIFRSATMQHSISASLNNLLVMEEFQPIVKLFGVGNWIRIKSDGNIYRLRLAEYTVDYNTWDLEVVFTDLREGYSTASDLQNLMSSLRSMQTTYGAVAKQAANGEQGKETMDRWVNEGLALTTQIVGGANNQEFNWDETGFTGKELIEETGTYSPEQIKIISHGIYMTTDNWVTAKAGLGRFRFLNPQNNFQEEDAFGVIADKLVGNLILSEEVGIYNGNGSITLDRNGFTMITNASNNTKVFTIKKQNGSSYSNILSIDASGNLVLGGDGITGTINASKVNVTNISASNITTGTLNVDRISANSVPIGKLSGSITGKGYSTDSASWGINFTTGVMTIGNISADNIKAGTINVDRISGHSVPVGKLSGSIINNNWGIDFTNGTMSIGKLAVGSITGNIANGNWKLDFTAGTFTIGNISAGNITTGTLSADRIGGHSIGTGKLSGSITNSGWGIDFTNGTMSIGTLSAGNITSGTMSADRISGGTLTLGGYNNINGKISVKNANGTEVGTWDQYGIKIQASYSSEDYMEVTTSGITFEYSGYVYQFGSNGLQFGAGYLNYSTLMINNGTGTASCEPGTMNVNDGYGGFSYMSGGEVYASDELSTGGSKPRIVTTENFGMVRMCAYETPTPMFGDIGEAVIDEDGKAYIFIDPVFYETVCNDVAYQVFLQKYGNGNCWVSKRAKGYFIVEGDPGLVFSWEIKAKQIDYDQWRFEVFEFPEDRAVKKNDLDIDAEQFIEKYYKGLVD